MKTVFARLLFAVGVCVSGLSACSSVQYTAPPMAATVVDSESGQPLAGVYVVADWQLEGGLEGGSRLGAIMMMETQTDANGRFEFPGWGPKDPLSVGVRTGNARLKNSTPQLLLFKPGYEYDRLRNPSSTDPAPAIVRSLWDGKRIELRRFRGDTFQYEQLVGSLSRELMHDSANASGCTEARACITACQWERIPRTIRAIERQYQEFKAAGIRAGNIYLNLVMADAEYQKLGCASAIKVLKGDGP